MALPSTTSTRALLLLLLGIVMVGCAPPSFIESSGGRSSASEDDDENEKGGKTADESRKSTFNPSLPSTLVTTSAGTSRVSYVERDGKRIAFGDIVLPTGAKRVATAVGEVQVWPGGIVPYVVSSDDTAAMEEGIALWAAKTPSVKFVPRTNETDYIDVIKGQGCYSMIGRVGGRQELSLGDGCAFAHVVAHELGHALGLWHEQSRADRDEFLNVQPQNADAAMIHNFDKLTFQSIGAFDYDSIMLYSSYAFSNNQQPTILRTDGSEITDNMDVSVNDAAGIAALYAGVSGTGEPGAEGEEGAEIENPEPGVAGETITATTTANLRLRSGPTAADAVLAVMPTGSAVELTGEVSGDYVAVVFGGVSGWAHASYLQ